PGSRCNWSRRTLPSLPPCTAKPPASRPGLVEPRSASDDSSAFWSVGVQCRSMLAASGERTSVLSPQSVLPFHGPLPVATTRVTFDGSTAAPFRDQIAESLDEHVRGTIIVWRFEQS